MFDNKDYNEFKNDEPASENTSVPLRENSSVSSDESTFVQSEKNGSGVSGENGEVSNGGSEKTEITDGFEGADESGNTSSYGYSKEDLDRLGIQRFDETSGDNEDNSDSENQNEQNPYGNGQNPYGQNPYGNNQNPYGQNPYGNNQNPYGQNPYGNGQNPYGQNPYGNNQNPYGQNPYGNGQNPYGQNPYGNGQNPYGQNPYGNGQSPYGQNPYGNGQNPYGQNPYGNGQNPYGQNPYGNGQNPYGQNPYGNGQNPQFDNGNQNGPEIPPTQKGKSIFWGISAVMAVISIVAIVFLAERFGNGKGYIDESSAELPSHEYTSTVIEHVKTEEPQKEIYTNKTQLYDDSQKSCVTVITTVKSNFYGQVTESKALGSGFVVSKDGYIITNAHVVEGGTDFKVRFYDGKEADALLIGKETYCDIAVIKIRPSKDLVPVSFGDSSKVRVGDFAMAIGTPSSEDLFGTMTFGVISGKERKLPMTNSAGQTVRTMYLIQTDATLNPGNSGGPLFNMYGQVIGINTMKLMDDYEGMGFAIPSSGAVKIINSLISTGEADYTDSEYVKGGSQLGIKGLTLTADAKKEYGFSEDAPEGVLIVSIEKKSSAYKAGVSGYDVICEFNGKTIKTIEQLISEIQKCHPGEKATVKVYRVERGSKKGEYHTYTFALDAVEE